jgi:hypothetical protein
MSNNRTSIINHNYRECRNLLLLGLLGWVELVIIFTTFFTEFEFVYWEDKIIDWGENINTIKWIEYIHLGNDEMAIFWKYEKLFQI